MSDLDSIHYQILGKTSGPKMVFLHGLMGSGANWRKVTSAFENDYHILVFDQRGHGRSFHPPTGYEAEDFASDLVKILDKLGWEKVFLVGHSMGGRNALVFTSLWMHRVMGLVIEDIGPDANAEAAKKIEDLLALVPTPFVSRAAARHFLLEEFPRLLAHNPHRQTLANFFYSNIEEKSDGRADWRFSKSGVLAAVRAGRLRERWVEFQSIKAPTLVIRGENSEDLSREVFKRMLKANPHAQGVEIANSGHWVHFDQTEAFVAELKKFLAEVLRMA